MAKGARPSIEQALARLTAMERGLAPIDRPTVAQGLESRAGVVVAAAARVVAGDGDRALVAAMGPTFARLVQGGAERDPACRGKIAIARALQQLEQWDDQVFPVGIGLTQFEAVWGGREDTAAEVRAICAMAFAHHHRPDALERLADLLADPARVARIGAATALGDSGHADAAALLRFKVRIGDAEPDVLVACLSSLLVLSPARSRALCEELLASADDRAAAAALALGESRRADAVPVLVAWCERVPAAVRARVGYAALAMLRDPVATDYLIARITEGHRADAQAAVAALTPYASDPRLAARLDAARRSAGA